MNIVVIIGKKHPQSFHVECVVALYSNEYRNSKEILETKHFCEMTSFKKNDDNSMEKELIKEVRVSAVVDLV